MEGFTEFEAFEKPVYFKGEEIVWDKYDSLQGPTQTYVTNASNVALRKGAIVKVDETQPASFTLTDGGASLSKYDTLASPTDTYVGDVVINNGQLIGIQREDGRIQTYGLTSVKTSSEQWDEAWVGAALKAKELNHTFSGIERSTNQEWQGNRSTWFGPQETLTPESFSDSLPMGWRKMTNMHAYQHAFSGKIVEATEVDREMSLFDYLSLVGSDLDEYSGEWTTIGDCRA